MKRRFLVPAIVLLACLTAVEAADIEIGYDDIIKDGTVSLEPGVKYFVRFPQYFEVPCEVREITAWFSRDDTCRLRLYPDRTGAPDTSRCLHDTTVSLGASRWKAYPFPAQVNDTGDLWVCVTGTNGQLHTDRSYPDGNSWRCSGGTMERLDSCDLMVRLRMSGPALSRDVGVRSIDNPFWYVAPTGLTVTPRATVENPGADTETFDVTCDIDSSGTRVYSSTRSVTLTPDSTARVVFDSGWTVGDSGAVYRMQVYTRLAGDLFRHNDTLEKNLTSDCEEELFYDLRTQNIAFVRMQPTNLLARITPAAYPARIAQIKMSFYPIGFPDSFQFRLAAYGDQNPEDLHTYEPDMADLVWEGQRYTHNGYGWREFDVLNEGIIVDNVDKEVYVGFTLPVHGGGSFNGHADDRYPGATPYGFPGRTGFNTSPSPSRGLLIRAQVRYFPAAAVSEPPKTQPHRVTGLRVTPNPTSGRTRLHLDLPARTDVELRLYDASGRHLRTLGRETLGPGLNVVDLNLEELTAGVYFLKAKTREAILTERIAVVR